MGKVYFLGDLHLGHKNCLAYDNRPFKNIEEHDAFIIKNWKETVTDEDDLYLLGDISWHGVGKTIEILRDLPGKLHLLIGNHDHRFLKNAEFRKLFVDISHYMEITLEDGKFVVLSHWPMPCFNRHYYGAYHLYAHVHTSFEFNMMENFKYQMKELYDKPCNMYNVGAMLPYMGYTPKTLDLIMM